MQDFNPFDTTTTRTGRTLDRPNIFSPFLANHNIQPIVPHISHDPLIFPNYSKPQPMFNQNFQNFLLDPTTLQTGQATKISKSVSPSRYATPSTTASTLSNTSNNPTTPPTNHRIFAPTTPTMVPTSPDFPYNKVIIPSSQKSYTPTNVAGNYGSNTSISPYSSNGGHSASTSPFNAANTQTGSYGTVKTPLGSSEDPNKKIQKFVVPISQLPNTPINNMKIKNFPFSSMTPSGTSTQKIVFPTNKENGGYPGSNPSSKPTTPMQRVPILPAHNVKTPKNGDDDPQLIFSRANCTVETGYTTPKQHDDPDAGMRFSVIKSDFKDNPYIYNLDDVPYSRRDTIKTQDSFSLDTSKLSMSSLFTHSIRLDNQGDYKTLLNRLKASGEKFYDNNFPPTLHSLVGDNGFRRPGWEDYIWLRPEEFFGEKYELFVDKIEPDDISQGQLGDCYFLSVLSSLAEWPDRVRKVFKSKERNNAGCYCVRMCVMGEWKEIIVDDFFPCDRRTRKPVFSRSATNELWVLILEKAWAKLYGSYDNIEAGLARECLHDLTCAPTTFFLTDDKKEWDIIWKKILKSEKKNYVMTCGAGDFFTMLAETSRSGRSVDPQNIVNSMGLVSSHAYSLLAGYEVNNRYGSKVKLLKLRNPWGKTEWTGAWSDNSIEWDDNLRRKMGVEAKDDGDFFIEYSDFLKYFSDVQFCFVNDKYEYGYKTLHSDARHAAYTKVTVTTEGKYYFTVNQESKRRFGCNTADKYPSVTIVLAKLNKTSNGWDYEHIEGNQRADREVWIKAKLKPGDYLVYTKVVWNYCQDSDLVLSSYGPSKAQFQEVKKNDYPGFLDKTFCSKAQRSNKKADFAREGEASAYSVVELAKDGFIYCYYHNDSKRTLEVQVTYRELTGLKLRKPFRGKEFELKINPGERKVVLLRVLPHSNVRQLLSERVRFVDAENNAGYKPDTGISSYGNVQANDTGADSDKTVKEKGKVEKLRNPVTKETLDISVYEYKHEDGYVLLYENHTKNFVLNERVEYTGYGLMLYSPVETDFALMPGMTKKLVYKRVEPSFVAKFKFHSKLKEIQ